ELTPQRVAQMIEPRVAVRVDEQDAHVAREQAPERLAQRALLCRRRQLVDPIAGHAERSLTEQACDAGEIDLAAPRLLPALGIERRTSIPAGSLGGLAPRDRQAVAG